MTLYDAEIFVCGFRKKHKAYISKYKALVLKYKPYIFEKKPCNFSDEVSNRKTKAYKNRNLNRKFVSACSKK